MPDFAYIARTTTGQRVEGVLSAGTQREALLALAGKELFPVQVKASGGKTAQAGGLKVRPQAMSQFYVQMAALLRSGVPLLRSLGPELVVGPEWTVKVNPGGQDPALVAR